MAWQPRNDSVLVRIIDLSVTPTGIQLPDASIEGKEFLVEAIGPTVKDLEPGDKVLMLGKQGVEFFPLPNSKNLIVLKQEYVVLKQVEI